jgi:hypothetical protein
MTFWLNNDSIIIDNDGNFIICDECPCNKKFYIIGYCRKKIIDDIPLDTSGEYHEGDLSSLYIVEEKFLWGQHVYLNDKIQYVVSGPHDSPEETESYLLNNKNSLLATLFEKCTGNSLTISFDWQEENGCDLDLRIDIDDESYGYGYIYPYRYGQSSSGVYGTQYGDDTTCGKLGGEKLSLNRKNLILKFGDGFVEIPGYAHWWDKMKNGDFIMNIISSESSYRKLFHSDICIKSIEKDSYTYIGKIIYYPNTDKFKFIENI